MILVTEEESSHHEEEEEHIFLHLMSNYRSMTFEVGWEEGCYYVVEGADRKWGGGCHFKRSWEDPIRFALILFSCFNFFLLVRHFVKVTFFVMKAI